MDAGAPQGAVLSPLLSNVYLNPLDHLLAQAGYQMVRYADDFVILSRSNAEAQAALEFVQNWVAENGLLLHPAKTRLVDVREEGFDFLGYHFANTQKGIRHGVSEKSVRKLKDTLRAKTKRTNGNSLEFVIANVNRTLRGCVLPAQPPMGFRAVGQFSAPTAASDPEETPETSRLRQRMGLLTLRPRLGLPILTEMNP